jgi:hypothetical protein
LSCLVFGTQTHFLSQKGIYAVCQYDAGGKDIASRSPDPHADSAAMFPDHFIDGRFGQNFGTRPLRPLAQPLIESGPEDAKYHWTFAIRPLIHQTDKVVAGHHTQNMFDDPPFPWPFLLFVFRQILKRFSVKDATGDVLGPWILTPF